MKTTITTIAILLALSTGCSHNSKSWQIETLESMNQDLMSIVIAREAEISKLQLLALDADNEYIEHIEDLYYEIDTMQQCRQDSVIAEE